MIESRTDGDQLLGRGEFLDYNAAERHYSAHVRETLVKLLRGDCDTVDLMARYPQDPRRLGAVPTPRTIDPRDLRLPKVEEILSSSLRFLYDGREGGPVTQSVDEDHGVIIQRRDFPTRFPHIVIQRTDLYEAEKGDPIESSWRVHRVQNQRHSIQVNRLLDAMNLGLELLRWAL